MLIQILMSYAKKKNQNESERERESESESESESERGNRLAPPNPKMKRRASAPGGIELTNLRPPTSEDSFRSSFASAYSDAVVHIGTDDSDSDA